MMLKITAEAVEKNSPSLASRAAHVKQAKTKAEHVMGAHGIGGVLQSRAKNLAGETAERKRTESGMCKWGESGNPTDCSGG